jgi:peptidoglycan hydrolase-like protein with peptidoglycan-binding domain
MFEDASNAGLDPAGRVKQHIGRGDHGSDVRLWQHLLNVVDKAQLHVDGTFGKKTELATIKWQKAHHKKPDGTVWPETVQELEKAVARL